MNVLSWVIFGLIVGIIAHFLDPRGEERGGVVGTVILGILGALVGGLIANVVFGIGLRGFDFQSFIIAMAGSLILLVIQRGVRRI
jgi:uncharacterized membrane protein YeaQ/YmgE (transglycosylase-associated protein family)